MYNSEIHCKCLQEIAGTLQILQKTPAESLQFPANICSVVVLLKRASLKSQISMPLKQSKSKTFCAKLCVDCNPNIQLGLDSSTLNIPYWDFKYKHNLQGLQKCEYKHNLLGLRKCEYKHNLLGLPKVSKNTPWWELCTHLDRKILFQSLECAKDKKCHLPVPKWDFFMWGIKMISI